MQPAGPGEVGGGEGVNDVPKPPKTPPSSDIDGVDEDAAPNTDAAIASGQDSGDLERARRNSPGRPAHTRDEKGRDDRSR